MPVKCVVVEVHLGVERDHVASAGHDQRIDLDQRAVELGKGPVEAAQQGREIADLLAGQSERERDLAAMVALVAGRRVDRLLHDLLGRLVRHRFDIHAACGRRDNGNAAHGAVDQHREIELAFDVAAILDVEPLHRAPRLAGLLGDQVMAQHGGGAGADLVDRLHDPHATLALGIVLEPARPSAAGVNLRLYDGHRAAQLPRDVHRLVLGVSHAPFQQGDSEFGQQCLGLIFVDVHGVLSFGTKGQMRAQHVGCKTQLIDACGTL